MSESIWESVADGVKRLPVPGGWIYRTYSGGGTYPNAVFVPAASGNVVAINERCKVSIARVEDRPKARWRPDSIEETPVFEGWLSREVRGQPGYFAIPEHWILPLDYPYSTPEFIEATRKFYFDHLVGCHAVGMFEDGTVAIVTDKGFVGVVMADCLIIEEGKK